MGRGRTIRQLVTTLPEHCFWVHDGPILSDLTELRHALQHEITDEQFNHHVSEEKNDFADWIRDALHDGHCATEVASAKKKSTVIKRIDACLKRYKK